MSPDDLVLIKKNILDILEAHDRNDFAAFCEFAKPAKEGDPPLISEEEFNNACQTLNDKYGGFVSLDFITFLNKGNSVQSLWKAIYGPQKFEILWQIYLVKAPVQGYRIIALWYN